jgi:hypothetical protein
MDAIDGTQLNTSLSVSSQHAGGRKGQGSTLAQRQAQKEEQTTQRKRIRGQDDPFETPSGRWCFDVVIPEAAVAQRVMGIRGEVLER